MSPVVLPPARSVLITGASGLVGSQVVALLAADPGAVETVVALDLRDVPDERRLAGIDYQLGDIRDPGLETLLRARDIDTVVHLAAIVSLGKDRPREHDYSVDVLGTENVLGCAQRAGVRHLVYTSSGAAYGYHADNPTPLDEDDTLRGNPEFAYSDHKRLVEVMLERHRREHPELGQLVFRPGTILGEHAANPITAIFDRPVVVGVRGTDSPFVLVWDEDVARCVLEGIRERRTGIYNLTGDGVITLREIAGRLHKRYVALPVPVLAGALRVLKALRLSRAGPEHVNFLRYRPVLSNENLERDFDLTPSATSEECFERYRRIRFPS
ncbi:MAG: SDR family oxidoreductase [Acidimicrobiia bacterium]|nr:SDR family oxidoreductase [Acidimicrobiia bacterium]